MRQSAQGAVKTRSGEGEDRRMTMVKFGVGDVVRFIGTDRALTVTQYNPETLEYRVQRGDDHFGGQWISEIYIEACLTPER
jgi:hypothetical protein